MDNIKIPFKYEVLLFIVFMIIVCIVGVVLNKDKLFKATTSKDFNKVSNLALITTNNINVFITTDKSNNIIKVIYIDKTSSDLLSDKVKTSSISNFVYSIVNTLNSKKITPKNIIITSFDNDVISNTLQEEFNKNLVIFSINSNVSINSTTISAYLNSINVTPTTKFSTNIKLLNNYAQDNLYFEKTSADPLTLATDIYNSLVDYANGKLDGYNVSVENQEKSDPNGLDITLLGSEYKPTKDSWYYIKEKLVYASINLKINDINYSYCFEGSTSNIIEGTC